MDNSIKPIMMTMRVKNNNIDNIDNADIVIVILIDAEMRMRMNDEDNGIDIGLHQRLVHFITRMVSYNYISSPTIDVSTEGSLEAATEEIMTLGSQNLQFRQLNFHQLLDMVEESVSKDVADTLYNRCREISKTPDTMQDFISYMEKVISRAAECGFNSSGLFAIHLRRFLLNASTSFESLIRIHSNFRRYIYLLAERDGQGKLATAKKVIEYHVSDRTKYIEQNLGKMSFDVIEVEIQKLIQAYPSLNRAHYLRFLNCLHHREYQGAVDSLHTYFDYCSRDAFAGAAVALTNGVTSINPRKQAGNVLQFSLINLAALHLAFGHYQEARIAAEEAICIAQQKGDHLCVDIALCLLFKTVSGYGQNKNAHQILTRCLHQARKLNSPHIEALLRLYSVQRYMQSDDSDDQIMSPRDIWTALQNVIDSASVGYNVFSSSAPEFINFNPNLNPTNRADVRQLGNASGDGASIINHLGSDPYELSKIHSVSGESEIIKSSFWSNFGHLGLSLASAKSFLYHYSHNGPSIHASLGIHQIALSQVQYGGLDKIVESSRNRTFDNVYDPAISILRSTSRQYTNTRANSGVLKNGYIFIESIASLARGQLHRSDRLTSLACALSPPSHHFGEIAGENVGKHLQIMAEKLRSQFLSECGFVYDMFVQNHLLSHHAHQARLKHEEIQIELNNARSILLNNRHSEPSILASALPYILRSFNSAEQLHLHNLRACAAMELARLFVAFGFTSKAISLLQSIRHQIDGHGEILSKAEMHLLFAQVYCIQHRYKDATAHLDESHKHYRYLEHSEKLSEVAYCQARVYDMIGDHEAREEASSRYLSYIGRH